MAAKTLCALVLVALLATAMALEPQLSTGPGEVVEAPQGRQLKFFWWGGHRYFWYGGHRWYDDDWCGSKHHKCWDDHDDECDCDEGHYKWKRYRC